jgi:chromosome segregation ATPase
MSLEDTELTIGGTKLRGVWIAIVLSIATTMAGGIWAVAEFYGRIEAVEAAVSGNGDTAEKLTVLGTNLETIMENQKQLLDLRDRIAEVETTTTANDLLVKQFDEKVKSIDSRFSKINREIDDLWRGLDAASNPLK